ncbi:esterase/lipase family protein [Pseudofrankia saprophytica]|nr:alpha/beta fold hydrolase [Pseudofrankia saprophytica]
MLAVPGTDPPELVWAAGLRDIGDVLRHPERLSVEERPELRPLGLIRSRKAFGVWTAVRGYEGLLGRLMALDGAVLDDGSRPVPNLDATVVAFGYDFRRSVADAARRLDDEIRQRVRHLWPQDPLQAARVLLVAHSMGGLVARYWAALPGNDQLCRAMLTLGTPHRGAPKALDILANGVAVGPSRIRRPREVLRGWPSVAELMPRYPAIADLRQPSHGSPHRSLERRASAANGRGRGFLRPDEVPMDWLEPLARGAAKVHQAIDACWNDMPRTGPQVTPRIGYGHGTLRGCSWDGEKVRVGRAVGTAGLGAWADDLGDGTVPAISGLPVEMERHSPQDLRVAFRHGAIVDLDEVVPWVESFERRPADLQYYRKPDERPVALCLELDELALAGRALSVAATVRGVDADLSSTAMWVTLRPEAKQGSSADVRLAWDGSGRAFHGELATALPGVYRLQVDAREVPQAGWLRAAEVVEVLDNVDLD